MDNTVRVVGHRFQCGNRHNVIISIGSAKERYATIEFSRKLVSIFNGILVAYPRVVCTTNLQVYFFVAARIPEICAF